MPALQKRGLYREIPSWQADQRMELRSISAAFAMSPSMSKVSFSFSVWSRRSSDIWSRQSKSDFQIAMQSAKLKVAGGNVSESNSSSRVEITITQKMVAM